MADAADASSIRDINSTNYLGTASMALLLYDHLLTLDDEIQYIWRRRLSLITYLFLINRYLTPLGFIVNMLAYLSPLFTPEVCVHFVRYEGAFTTVSVGIAASMMIIRVYAVYGENKGILALLALVLSAQVGVQAWLLSGAQAVPHPAGEHNCTMVFGNNVGSWGSAYAWMPLLFDTTVLALTVLRTLGLVRSGRAGNIVRTLLRDGIMYYSVIFSANLVLTVMLISAPVGIKGIAAQFEQLITVTMMSRITINLKKHAVQGGQSNVSELAFGHTGMTTGVTMAAHHSATENTSSTPSAARSREEGTGDREAFEMWNMESKRSARSGPEPTQ